MALARWQATIVDEAGNIQSGASVEVRSETAGAPLATIYSDRDGTTPLGNPFTADSEGFAAFHVAGGAYKITATKSAFSREWRYVGVGTASELDSYSGLTADQFLTGDGGSAIKTIPVYYDASNDRIAIGFQEFEMDIGGSTVASKLAIHHEGGEAIGEFHVHATGSGILDGPVVYGARSDGDEATPTIVADGDFLFSLAALGFDGTDYAQGARIDFIVDGTPGSGDMPTKIVFSTSADGGETPAAVVAFNPDQTAEFTHAPNQATNAQVRAATAERVITADLLESASAEVTLSDAATIALDWASGVNFTVELTTDRVLGNPTNGQPGTWRTVRVTSDGGPDALTFDSEYGGAPPTLDDITTTQHYLVMIYCVSTSLFLVGSMDASPA